MAQAHCVIVRAHTRLEALRTPDPSSRIRSRQQRPSSRRLDRVVVRGLIEAVTKRSVRAARSEAAAQRLRRDRRSGHSPPACAPHYARPPTATACRRRCRCCAGRTGVCGVDWLNACARMAAAACCMPMPPRLIVQVGAVPTAKPAAWHGLLGAFRVGLDPSYRPKKEPSWHAPRSSAWRIVRSDTPA
jgi:hypothetical protein